MSRRSLSVVPQQVLKDADVQPQDGRRGADVRLDARDFRRPLTSAEALEFLHLPSLGALYWHIKENRLPTRRIGNRYRFDRAELNAWMQGLSTIELLRARKRVG